MKNDKSMHKARYIENIGFVFCKDCRGIGITSKNVKCDSCEGTGKLPILRVFHQNELDGRMIEEPNNES